MSGPVTLEGLARTAAVEAVATAFLLIAIVGSGIAAERYSDHDAAVSLLVNALCTGAALTALILTFGTLSGAHMNPAVSIGEAIRGAMPWRTAGVYVVAQVLGAIAGTMIANLMFHLPAVEWSDHPRATNATFLAEVVATFGLLLVIRGSARVNLTAVAIAVGAFIGAGLWFTSSTAFANPAVTVARTFTDTYCGIRGADIVPFAGAQFMGMALAAAWSRWMDGPTSTSSD